MDTVVKNCNIQTHKRARVCRIHWMCPVRPDQEDTPFDPDNALLHDYVLFDILPNSVCQKGKKSSEQRKWRLTVFLWLKADDNEQQHIVLSPLLVPHRSCVKHLRLP